MRNLTIRRNKAFPGCLVKSLVYIEDPNGELTISGVPCRLLGTLKNGEEKTFCIDCQQRQLFLIFKTKTKDKMNSSVTIPAGEENVCLSGKYHMDMGHFPFHFDGIALTPEQKARAQEQKKRSSRTTMIGAVIGIAIGVAVLIFTSNYSSKPASKTFSKEDFSITLTEDFEEVWQEDAFVSYESNTTAIVVVQEPKVFFGNISLREYAQLLVDINALQVTVQEKDGLIWFSYVRTVEDIQFYYMAFCYESDAEFWAVNFIAPVAKQDKHEKEFMQWAQTVQLAQGT